MRLKYKSIFVCTLKLPHFTETRLQSRLAQLQIGFSLYDKVPDGSKSQPELSFCLISTTTHFWFALKHTTYYKTSSTVQFVSSTSQFSFAPWNCHTLRTTRLQSRLAQLQIGFSFYDKVPDGSKSQPELSFCLISTTTHFWSALKHTTYYKTSATLQFVSSTSQFSFTPWSKKYHNNSITKQIGSTTNRFQFLLWSTWWFQISTRAQFLLDLNHNSLLVRT